MDARALDEIQRFLRTVGKESLFDYFSVRADAPDDTIAAALRDKRAWAQGQQSNPKYRQEAVWVIKNSALCRRALVDERAAYLDALRSGEESRQIQVLGLFIQGSLAEGVLTPSAESAIRQQGQRLGLSPARVEECIESQLRQSGAVRTTTAPPVDPWAELDLPRSADRAAIERAYEDKSAFARRNPDGRVAAELLARLDAARKAALARPEPPTGPTPVAVTETPTGPLDSEGRGAPSSPSPAEPAPAPPRNAPASPAPSPAVPAEPLRPTPTLPPVAAPAAEPSTGGLRLAGAAPPAPPPGVARALPSSPEGGVSRAPSRAARLEIEGPEQRALTVGSHGRLTVVLHRVGAGPLPGRAFSDREWVTVDPPRFDLNAERQELTVRIDGRAMGRRRAVALVSFVADDGQRRSVTIETHRRAWWPALLGLAAASVVSAGLWWAGQQEPPPPAPTPTVLDIRVDPPAGQIFVNERLVSDNGVAELREGIPEGGTAQVRVELDGFAPWSESVAVPARARTVLAPALTLTDPMDWRPAPEAVRAELDERAARKALDARSGAWGVCFAAHAAGEPGSTQSAELELRVNARGAIAGVDVGEASFPVTAGWRGCMLRQLRAVRMPLVPGDYASFKHTFRASLPARGTP